MTNILGGFKQKKRILWNSGPEVERSFTLNWSVDRAGFPGASRGHCSLTCLNSQRPPEFLVHNLLPLLQLPGMRLHLRSSNLPLPNSYGDTVITFKIQVTSLSQDIYSHISHEHDCPSICLNTCYQSCGIYTQKWNRWVLCQFYMKLADAFSVVPTKTCEGLNTFYLYQHLLFSIYFLL